MALRFSKKKPDDDDAGDSGKEALAFQAQPEKARGWFEHGRKAADPDYALTCFANGIRLDPSPMSAHEAMFDAAVKYTGKPAAGKDVRKIDGPHPVEKFAAADESRLFGQTGMLDQLLRQHDPAVAVEGEALGAGKKRGRKHVLFVRKHVVLVHSA